MSKKCIHTYVGLSITDTGGKLNPCCIFNKGKVPTLYNVDTLNNLHNLPQYKEIQEKLKNNISIPECSSCDFRERNGIKSRRQESNEMFPFETLENGYLQDLEVSLDYTCNMMCRMCSPFVSSKWGAAKEVLESFNDAGIETNNFDSKMYKRYQDQFYKVFNNTDFKHVRHLKIEGGEPFYAKNFEWFLDKLYTESIDRKRVRLNIFSNGSTFPNKDILTKLESFDTTITFSLDAHGELATVIRNGVEWDTVEKCVRQWANFAKNSNIGLCTNTTLSILNINMISPLQEFCKEVDITINYNDLSNPAYLSMYQLPLSIRNQWADISKGSSFNQFLLLDIITPNEFAKFLKSVEILDEYQKVKFQDANPEIYNIVQELTGK